MNKTLTHFISGAILSVVSLGCFAETTAQETKKDGSEQTNNSNSGNGASSTDKSSYMGLGVGIGVEQYRQGSYIESASTNGNDRIVTIDKEYRTVPSVWFTANWSMAWRNFAGEQKPQVCEEPISGNVVVCYGGFVGVKLFDANASSGALRGFALGPQVTFKTKSRTYSLGLGWVNHQTKKLASGIEDGKPLPGQYSDIKYREQSENSYMLMFSTNLFEK